VSSIMRSKYGTYPEYHTSLDNLDFVSARGLEDSLRAHQHLMETLEGECTPVATMPCEVMMSKRGLRPTIGKRGSAEGARVIGNLLAYADGRRSLLEIAEVIGQPAWELRAIAERLADLRLLSLEPAAGR